MTPASETSIGIRTGPVPGSLDGAGRRSFLLNLPFPCARVPKFPVAGIVIEILEGATVRMIKSITGPELTATVRPELVIVNFTAVCFKVQIPAWVIPHDSVPKVNSTLE